MRSDIDILHALLKERLSTMDAALDYLSALACDHSDAAIATGYVRRARNYIPARGATPHDATIELIREIYNLLLPCLHYLDKLHYNQDARRARAAVLHLLDFINTGLH